MKPVYLCFCGINSFSEQAEVRFESLLQYGIFGIFGDTGSGKSTILDCIAFALYGGVSRSRAGSIADIINFRCNSAYVYFEFDIVFEGERRRFRVERTLKRKNAAQTLVVYEKTGDKFLAAATGVREGNALIERIIGLEQKDFEKCIALPQGEFAQFVKAQRSDRLKLISRLFDLEQYGERLVKLVNARCTADRQKLEVSEARLEPYRDVTEESIRLRKDAIALAEKEEAVASSRLAEARAIREQCSVHLQKSKEAARVRERLEELTQKKGEMQELKQALSRLEAASSAVAAAKDYERSASRMGEAETALAQAQAALTQAETAYEAISGWDEEAAEREIERLTDLRLLAEKAADSRRREAELVRRREETLSALTENARHDLSFCYEEEHAALEARIQALGEDGDFLSFAETHGREALFRNEYGQFASELEDLERKYPVIAPDSRPIAQRYRTLSEGERLDFSALRVSYDERARERRRLTDELVDLEKKRGETELARREGERLGLELISLEKQIEECRQALADAPDLAETSKLLEAKKAEKREKSAGMRSLKESLSAAHTRYSAASERLDFLKKDLDGAGSRLKEELAKGAFASPAEAEALTERYRGFAEATRTYEAYTAELALLEKEKAKFSEIPAVTEQMLEEADAACAEAESLLRDASARRALSRDEWEREEKALAEKKAISEENERLARNARCSSRLKSYLDGNKFMEYVAEEYLVTIAAGASGRLLSLTGGRYFLRYEKGFFVGDNYSGGELRGVHTLSGGETFLVSLSLALSLGAEICAKSLRPVEFFFLDEGFGTLDERLVDVVMDSLEKLRSESFSVGIISHVGELKHRIDRKLLVTKATEDRGSSIREE